MINDIVCSLKYVHSSFYEYIFHDFIVSLYLILVI